MPDLPTKQTFASFANVIGGWCDSNDANLARELEALDGSANQRGGVMQRCRGCTPKEAAIWLRDTPEGRLWARQREGTKSMAQLVHEAVEASRLAADEANKHSGATTKEAPMSTATVLKNIKAMGEHGVTKLIQKYADSVKLPGETSAQAFTRVFTADTDEAKALRYVHAVSKDADYPRDPDFEDDRDADDEAALDELERLAEAERRKNPKLSKAQSFTKVFTDPANSRLAQRERRQAMRKIGATAV
jgi:hypothetical protein